MTCIIRGCVLLLIVLLALIIFQPYSVQAANYRWQAVNGLPYEYAFNGICAFNGALYSTGGQGPWFDGCSDFYVYTNGTWIWLEGQPLPANLSMHGASARSLSIVVIGGLKADDELQNGVACSNVYQFNGTTWSELASLPKALDRHAVATINGNVTYSVGGWDGAARVTNSYRFNGTAWTEPAGLGLPAAISGHSLTVFSNRLYLVGGYGDSGPRTNVYYSPSGSSWTEVAGLPVPTYDHAACVLGDYLFIIGGGAGPSGTTNVYCFDGTTWTQVKGLPVPRYGISADVLNGAIYVAGGGGTNVYRMTELVPVYTLTPSNGPYAGGNLVRINVTDGELGSGTDITNVTVGGTAVTAINAQNATSVVVTIPAGASTGTKTVVVQSTSLGNTTIASAYTYNPAGSINTYDWSQWEEIIGLPESMLQYAVGVVDGKIVATTPGDYYTFAGSSWTDEGIPPITYAGGASALYSNKLYFVGGWGGLTEVYYYVNSTWTEVAGLPTNRRFLAAATLGNRLYAIGGCNELANIGTNVFAYDGVAWSEVEGLPLALRELAGATLGSAIYVFGGYDGKNRTNTVFKFDGVQWTRAADLPTNIYQVTATTMGNYIYVYGGLAGAFQTNTYRFDGTSFTEVAGLPAARRGAGGATYSNKIYAIGGYGGSPSENKTNVYRYPSGNSGVSPSSGLCNGGYTVTIVGQNLGNGSDITNVTLCGVKAASIVSQSATQVVITAGSTGSGSTGDVRVCSVSYGVSVLSNGFAYAGTGKTPQTITFPPIANQRLTNIVRLAATASSGLPCSFAVVSGAANISGGTNLSFSALGPVSVRAAQAGNTNYEAAASVTNSFFVVGSFSARAFALTNSVVLRWSDPYTVGFASRAAHIRFATNDYPATTGDGSSLNTGTNQIYTHGGLDSERDYYYTIWLSQDGSSFTNPP